MNSYVVCLSWTATCINARIELRFAVVANVSWSSMPFFLVVPLCNVSCLTNSSPFQHFLYGIDQVTPHCIPTLEERGQFKCVIFFQWVQLFFHSTFPSWPLRLPQCFSVVLGNPNNYPLTIISTCMGHIFIFHVSYIVLSVFWRFSFSLLVVVLTVTRFRNCTVLVFSLRSTYYVPYCLIMLWLICMVCGQLFLLLTFTTIPNPFFLGNEAFNKKNLLYSYSQLFQHYIIIIIIIISVIIIIIFIIIICSILCMQKVHV